MTCYGAGKTNGSHKTSTENRDHGYLEKGHLTNELIVFQII